MSSANNGMGTNNPNSAKERKKQ